MTKNNIEDFDYEGFANEVGGEVLSEVEPVKQWVDTGNLALNFLCSGKFYGGGVPSGKIVEIFGASSSCKTLLAQNVLKGCQKANGLPIFLDAENTISKDFAEKVSHLDTKKVIVVRADTLQKAFGKIHEVVRKSVSHYGLERPIVIVYDSIAVSPSEREFAETKVEEGTSKKQRKEMGAGKEQPGERARICSSELRKLNPVLYANNTTVVFINQIRQKIGVMFGSPDTTAGGGKGLEFYCSIRLRTYASKKLKDSSGNIVGMRVTVSNVKNKCFRPFIQARDMNLYFDKGINPLSGLLDLLVGEKRVVASSKGNYVVSSTISPDKEIKFKASLERNDIPFEVLLSCPALVGATTKEELEEYVGDKNMLIDQNDEVEDVESDDELE